MNLRLHGQPIIDVDADRGQFAASASEGRFGQIHVREVVVRDTASAETVRSQVQVVKGRLFEVFTGSAGSFCFSSAVFALAWPPRARCPARARFLAFTELSM